MRIAMLFTAVSCAVLLAGCQQEEMDIPNPPPPLIPPEDSLKRQDTYNRAALSSFPLEVREAFRRDYPTGAVTQKEVQTPEAGPLLYRIVFIQDGRAQSVVYDRAGVVFNPPAPPRIESRPGFAPEIPVEAPPEPPAVQP